MPSANRAKDERFVRECPECTSVFSVKSSLVVSSAYLASTSGMAAWSPSFHCSPSHPPPGRVDDPGALFRVEIVKACPPLKRCAASSSAVASGSTLQKGST